MAENSVIISAEEEAKLLKPIDEYVEKIQKKIDALRVDRGRGLSGEALQEGLLRCSKQ